MATVIDITGAPPDLHNRAARTLTWHEAGLFMPPLPDEQVVLKRGAQRIDGRVYAVHYGDQTITVAPD